METNKNFIESPSNIEYKVNIYNNKKQLSNINNKKKYKYLSIFILIIFLILIGIILYIMYPKSNN